MPDRYAARRQQLVRKLREGDLPALLVTSVKNITYLTGFTGDSTYLLIGPKLAVLISDSRYTTQIEEECPGLEAQIRTAQKKMEDFTTEIFKKSGLARVAIEAGVMTVAQREGLEQKAKSLELVSTAGLVEELRQVKDEYEIGQIREAIRLAERGFAALRATLTPETSEREAAHDLEHTMRRLGARGVSFEPIVAVGARSALPHGRPTGEQMSAAGFVLVDWGAEGPTGYRSDLTRLLATAKIPPKLEKLYRVVLTAQQRGIDAIRPGARGDEVDAAARKVIEDAGYGKRFGHGLGHGIGLEIHEGPRLASTSETVLEPGMIVTVEPGIYLPGWGGIRIEDDVLVTSDGCEVLSNVPNDLDSIALHW